MKKLIILISIALTGCDNPKEGTVLLKSSNDEIEVHEYYINDHGSSIYIARYKNTPKVTSTTWYEHRGKTTVKCTSILIDSLTPNK